MKKLIRTTIRLTSTIVITSTLSLESPVADPLMTIGNLNRQFALGESEKEAVAWAWPQEMGERMFDVVNTYTRAAAMEGLPAESSFRLQQVGGEVLGMLR